VPETAVLPLLPFASAADWEHWLVVEHGRSAGIWMQIARKESGIPTVTYAEAIDVALCFGWIDGQKGKGDATHWLQRFTPRRARSRWSAINRDKVVALIEAGRMRPAGLREVEAAQGDGRWEAAYAGQASAVVPDDLRDALAAAGMRAVFDGLKSSERYAILYRVHDAKRAETRARRVAALVDLLARGETPHGLIG
jgi:uncharacterized protein YdeI (YjbR/CyaY-like superfamily)